VSSSSSAGASAPSFPLPPLSFPLSSLLPFTALGLLPSEMIRKQGT